VIKTRVQTGQFSTARGALWHIAAREGGAGVASGVQGLGRTVRGLG